MSQPTSQSVSQSVPIHLPDDRYFDPDPAQKSIAGQLYSTVADLPLICPHGHVDPRLFAEADYQFGTPTELFIVPDHYIFRMLYSQGVPLEDLGLPPLDGSPAETDHRRIWQRFADHFHLFRGTPTGMWLNHELRDLFGVQEKLTSASAQAIYDQVAACLATPEFQPRALYEQFKVEVLTTTDPATDSLAHHQAIRQSSWSGRILPTFRPDSVVQLDRPDWRDEIDALSEVSGIEVGDYGRYIQALETQRAHFKAMGATATDHDAPIPRTESLSLTEAEAIFQRALAGQTTPDDPPRFMAHMLMEFARMSVEDGLVMQIHPGSYRSHNRPLLQQFGRDMGADIPMATEYTHNLAPLLNQYGNDSRLTLILFTLDEATYGRELAPLAGHYPCLKLGPPWWFFDSLNGLRRYFDLVMETAGIYNTAGFNDDTRAFPSLPARHDLWRRAACNWIAGLVVRGIIDDQDAADMAHELAYGLAKRTYKFG